MEETVVLKLKTYNDLKEQIAFLEEGMMGAINGAIEAHEELEKKKNAYKPMIQEHIRRNTYGSDFHEFYESEAKRFAEQGIYPEMEAMRIEMQEEYEAKRVAERLADQQARQAKEDEETVRVIEQELAGQ